jgi:hypothetical protein
MNTELHDLLMSQLFANHFDLQKLDPTPRSKVGRWLLHSGYCLAAYALYVSKTRRSLELLKYFGHIFSQYEVAIGKEELAWNLDGISF